MNNNSTGAADNATMVNATTTNHYDHDNCMPNQNLFIACPILFLGLLSLYIGIMQHRLISFCRRYRDQGIDMAGRIVSKRLDEHDDDGKTRTFYYVTVRCVMDGVAMDNEARLSGDSLCHTPTPTQDEEQWSQFWYHHYELEATEQDMLVHIPGSHPKSVQFKKVVQKIAGKDNPVYLLYIGIVMIIAGVFTNFYTQWDTWNKCGVSGLDWAMWSITLYGFLYSVLVTREHNWERWGILRDNRWVNAPDCSQRDLHDFTASVVPTESSSRSATQNSSDVDENGNLELTGPPVRYLQHSEISNERRPRENEIIVLDDFYEFSEELTALWRNQAQDDSTHGNRRISKLPWTVYQFLRLSRPEIYEGARVATVANPESSEISRGHPDILVEFT